MTLHPQFLRKRFLTLKILSVACTDAINDFIEAHRKQQRLNASGRRGKPRKR